MRKQTKALVKIGVVYLAASIVLDYFLGAYQVLLWPALAFEFILFGIMILTTLGEQVAPRTGKAGPSNRQPEDRLARLKHLCKAAIDEGDQAAADILSERVRSLAFAAAANNLNTSEVTLRDVKQEGPNMLQRKINDDELFTALTAKGSMVRRGDVSVLEKLLEKVEEWAS